MSTAVVTKDNLKEIAGKAGKTASKGLIALRKVPTPVYYGIGALALYHWGIKPILKDAAGLFNTDPGNDQFQKDKNQILDRGTTDGSNTGSLSDQEIQNIANGQLSQMDRPGTGDNLTSDLTNLSGKDLQRVYVAFGKKWYDPFLGVQSGSLFSMIGHQEEDLFGWYRGELDPSELAIMRGIWQKSGLHFPQTNDMALS